MNVHQTHDLDGANDISPRSYREHTWLARPTTPKRLPDQVESWRINDVLEWLGTHVCLPEYKVNFARMSVDGITLLSINNYLLENEFGIESEVHRVKIEQHIIALKENRRADHTHWNPQAQGKGLVPDVSTQHAARLGISPINSPAGSRTGSLNGSPFPRTPNSTTNQKTGFPVDEPLVSMSALSMSTRSSNGTARSSSKSPNKHAPMDIHSRSPSKSPIRIPVDTNGRRKSAGTAVTIVPKTLSRNSSANLHSEVPADYLYPFGATAGAGSPLGPARRGAGFDDTPRPKLYHPVNGPEVLGLNGLINIEPWRWSQGAFDVDSGGQIVSINDNQTGKGGDVILGSWTCCQSVDPSAGPCQPSPHQGKHTTAHSKCVNCGIFFRIKDGFPGPCNYHASSEPSIVNAYGAVVWECCNTFGMKDSKYMLDRKGTKTSRHGCLTGAHVPEFPPMPKVKACTFCGEKNFKSWKDPCKRHPGLFCLYRRIRRITYDDVPSKKKVLRQEKDVYPQLPDYFKTKEPAEISFAMIPVPPLPPQTPPAKIIMSPIFQPLCCPISKEDIYSGKAKEQQLFSPEHIVAPPPPRRILHLCIVPPLEPLDIDPQLVGDDVTSPAPFKPVAIASLWHPAISIPVIAVPPLPASTESLNQSSPLSPSQRHHCPPSGESPKPFDNAAFPNGMRSPDPTILYGDSSNPNLLRPTSGTSFLEPASQGPLSMEYHAHQKRTERASNHDLSLEQDGIVAGFLGMAATSPQRNEQQAQYITRNTSSFAEGNVDKEVLSTMPHSGTMANLISSDENLLGNQRETYEQYVNEQERRLSGVQGPAQPDLGKELRIQMSDNRPPNCLPEPLPPPNLAAYRFRDPPRPIFPAGLPPKSDCLFAMACIEPPIIRPRRVGLPPRIFIKAAIYPPKPQNVLPPAKQPEYRAWQYEMRFEMPPISIQTTVPTAAMMRIRISSPSIADDVSPAFPVCDFHCLRRTCRGRHVKVFNRTQRPITVHPSRHFAEAPKGLVLDREYAWGFRLRVKTTFAARCNTEVELVPSEDVPSSGPARSRMFIVPVSYHWKDPDSREMREIRQKLQEQCGPLKYYNEHPADEVQRKTLHQNALTMAEFNSDHLVMPRARSRSRSPSSCCAGDSKRHSSGSLGISVARTNSTRLSASARTQSRQSSPTRKSFSSTTGADMYATPTDTHSLGVRTVQYGEMRQAQLKLQNEANLVAKGGAATSRTTRKAEANTGPYSHSAASLGTERIRFSGPRSVPGRTNQDHMADTHTSGEHDDLTLYSYGNSTRPPMSNRSGEYSDGEDNAEMQDRTADNKSCQSQTPRSVGAFSRLRRPLSAFSRSATVSPTKAFSPNRPAARTPTRRGSGVRRNWFAASPIQPETEEEQNEPTEVRTPKERPTFEKYSQEKSRSMSQHDLGKAVSCIDQQLLQQELDKLLRREKLLRQEMSSPGKASTPKAKGPESESYRKAVANAAAAWGSKNMHADGTLHKTGDVKTTVKEKIRVKRAGRGRFKVFGHNPQIVNLASNDA